MYKKIFFSLLVAVAFSGNMIAMNDNNQSPSKKKLMNDVKTEMHGFQDILDAHANGQNIEQFGYALQQFTQNNIKPHIKKEKYTKVNHYRNKKKGGAIKFFFLKNDPNTANISKNLFGND